ncbi:MAG: helix-turn-helix transcriptional regulator [Galactobacter sp.]
MAKLMTAKETAAAIGVAPSTFRAYVARSQAPRPTTTRGGANYWDAEQIAAWRGIDLPGLEVSARRVEASARLSRFRYWEESLQRDLTQIGFTPAEAQTFIDGMTPKQMPVWQFNDACSILEEHRRLHRELSHVAMAETFRTEADIVEAAASSIESDSNPFSVKTDMTIQLISHGFSEFLLPFEYSPEFWASRRDKHHWASYMLRQERIDIPEGI